jgi:beta-carotene 15,15'-dioxygenase
MRNGNSLSLKMPRTFVATILQTPTWISIFLGISLWAWGQFQGEIPSSVQTAFFAFFILLTGIPHGALDHLVAAKTAETQLKQFKILPFLLEYMGSMALYAAVWYFLPTLSLLFFLLISAWHFGETDLEDAGDTPLWNGAKFLFGALVLAFLLLSHAQEVQPLWARITQNDVWAGRLWEAAAMHNLVLGSILCFSFIFVSSVAHRQKPISINISRGLRLAFILILAYFLPLLPAFALYFGGWHALSAFGSIKNYLAKDTENSSNTPLSIWLKSLPFTLLATVFLCGGFWYWQYFLQTWDSLPILFIFLSLITLPHLRVMHPMNTARQSTSSSFSS